MTVFSTFQTVGRLEKGADQKKRDFVLTREANYHPDGGQVFYPKKGAAFVLLLALPGDDIKLEDFVAFYCDGSCGVCTQPPETRTFQNLFIPGILINILWKIECL